MSNRKRVWFEEAGRKLDPGLVEQLHLNRKEDPEETSGTSLPVIIHFKKATDENKKDKLFKICQQDKYSALGNELGTGNRDAVCGHLTPKKIREIKDRSEEHTSELQSRGQHVCRHQLEKKKHI